MIFTFAARPGCSSNGWMLPKVSFQSTTISILSRFMYEFISMRRYSAPGLYIIIGRYWLFPSTAIAKSDIALYSFELLPTWAKAYSLEPTFLGRDVSVVVRGRRDEANMTEATGLHRAI